MSFWLSLNLDQCDTIVLANSVSSEGYCFQVSIYIPRKRKRHTLEEEEELSEEEHKVKTNEFDDILPFMGDLKADTTGQDMSFQI